MLIFLFLLSALLATATAVAVDQGTERRGLMPPGFVSPHRRLAATFLLSAVFLLGVFLPLFTSSMAPAPDISSLGWAEIFGLQIILLFTLGLWYALGYFKVRPLPADGSSVFSQEVVSQSGELAVHPSVERKTARRLILRRLGLANRRIDREISIGLVVGLVAWMLVLLVSAILAGLLDQLGASDFLGLEQDPSPVIVWLAAQPVIIRCLISLAAGVSEELFFRGFLQPRIGIGLSTVLFVAGHAGYGQPMMLIGITVLSLIYARLFRWRGNVWAAMTAHTLFDAIQLLVVIPAALKTIGGSPVIG